MGCGGSKHRLDMVDDKKVTGSSLSYEDHCYPVHLLDTAVLSTIFSFLSWHEVLNARVCRQWKEAAVLAPIRELDVRRCEVGLDLPWITRSLSNIQSFKMIEESIKIRFGQPIFISHEIWRECRIPFVDLYPIENLKSLQHLTLRRTRMNGKYPFIFKFKNLLSLDLSGNSQLKWDLDLLGGLPQLEKLDCSCNPKLTGNLASVKVLSRTLIELRIGSCQNVNGSLADMYNMPVLEKLYVYGTAVTGDIRNIGRSDFPALTHLDLNEHIYGGGNLQRVHDAPSLMEAFYQLRKRIPNVDLERQQWFLANDSPDRYGVLSHHSREPPFYVELVQVGSRKGWRWTNKSIFEADGGDCCEINWLDPEPHPSEEGYKAYCRALEEETRRSIGFYRGFYKPPSLAEYR